MLDDADRESEAVEDGAHPLRVALGEVVVDRDDVDAAAGHARSARPRAAPTSVLPSPVFISAIFPWWRTTPPISWTSNGRIPSLRLADLAGRREDVRQDVVEDLLEPFVVGLLAIAADLRATLALGVLELVALGGSTGARPRRPPRRTCAISSRICSSVGACVVRLELVDRRDDGSEAGEMDFRCHRRRGGSEGCAWEAKYRCRIACTDPRGVGPVRRGASAAGAAAASRTGRSPLVLRAGVSLPYTRHAPRRRSHLRRRHRRIRGSRAPTSPGAGRRGRVVCREAVHRLRAVEVEIGDEGYTDLIACERDCRTCSYAAWLDCDGNCGVCPHNGYCPCVNPVVARSKTALRIIELRPRLLQEAQARG